jgi:hypothetical protein
LVGSSRLKIACAGTASIFADGWAARSERKTGTMGLEGCSVLSQRVHHNTIR